MRVLRGRFEALDHLDLAFNRILNWNSLEDVPQGGAVLGEVMTWDGSQWAPAVVSASGIVTVDVTWGDVTDKPTFVNSVTAGTGLQVSDTTGDVRVAITDDVRDSLRFFVGAFLESLSVDVNSDGTNITLTIASAADPVTLVFEDEYYSYTIAGNATIRLTEGTDTVPVLNYIWIPSDTKELTIGLAWPSTINYVPIATVLCQSAASAETYGLYKVHAWTDHTYKRNETGHLAHINLWIRSQHATWRSGIAPTPTLGADQFDVAIASGFVMQLHKHDFPAMTTVGGSEPMYVLNDQTTAYKRVANLSAELTDAAGGSLSGKYYNLVIWGIASEDAEDSKMMVNLPIGSYNTAAKAQVDVDSTAVFSIPEEFRGTGFLIARLIVGHSPAGNTFTLVETVDLRGTLPSGFSGGSAGAGDHGGLAGLADPDHPLTALQQSAATTNQVVEWNGTTWVPADIVNSVTAGDNITVSATNGPAVSIASVTNPNFTGDTTVGGILTSSGTIKSAKGVEVTAYWATPDLDAGIRFMTSANTGRFKLYTPISNKAILRMAASTNGSDWDTNLMVWMNDTGRVGINTDSPSAHLDVNGTIRGNAILADSNLYINYGGGDGNSFLYFYDGASPTGQYIQWDNGNTRFYLSNKLRVNGYAFVSGPVYNNSNYYANYSGPDGDSFLYFYADSSATGKHLKWDETDTRFEVDDDLFTSGDFIANGNLSLNVDQGAGSLPNTVINMGIVHTIQHSEVQNRFNFDDPVNATALMVGGVTLDITHIGGSGATTGQVPTWNATTSKWAADDPAGGADPNAVHTNAASEISAITEKVSPVSGDMLIIEDSAAADVKKMIQIGNLPSGAGGGFTLAALKTASVSVDTDNSLNDDAELHLDLEANTVYKMTAYIIWDAHSSADIKFGWSLNAESNCDMWWNYSDGTAYVTAYTKAQSLTANGSGEGSYKLTHFKGVVYTSTSAVTLTFRWCQKQSYAAGYAQVNKSSILTLQKVDDWDQTP